jgi:ATP-dependent RNA helicase DeaD
MFNNSKNRGCIVTMSKIKFDELNLSKELLRAISDMGFKQTTPIQSEAIPEILSGGDVIGQASTGTGKTAAFGLPAIEQIDEAIRAVQVLVLCPTRELAIQVTCEINKFLKYKKSMFALAVYGGQPIQKQLFGLRKWPKIVVGTPGRTLDHINRGTLKLNKVKMAILDEADEMLDMGFRNDIQDILKNTPESRQTVLFSATMSREILQLAKKFQKNPKFIKVSSENLAPKMIKQSYFDVEPSRKTKLLAQLLTEHNPRLSIVFCNTKRKVDQVCRDLRDRGFCSAVIHGDIRQKKRDSIMDKFRKEKVKVLVATDVAARGIDVSNIEVVFNYGIPKERESYVHRIGRTGRAGKTGKAISLVSRNEFRQLRDIMRYTNTDIERGMLDGLPDLDFAFKDGNAKPKPKAEAKPKPKPKAEKQNGIFKRINKRIRQTRKDELSRYMLLMNNLLDNNNNSLEDVSAALLKMVVEG